MSFPTFINRIMFTLSEIAGDDCWIMLPDGATIGDINADTTIFVLRATVWTVLGDRDENRQCLLADVMKLDMGKVAGLPLRSLKLYFLFDEADPDYVGEIEDAKFFMAEYVFDVDESAMPELEKKLDFLYSFCPKIIVPQYGVSGLLESVREKMEPQGTAWINLTSGVELTQYVGHPMITYWHEYAASETASDTTGL